ncbi:hypothetical protein EUZ85_30835 [Hahella sp. KA22]|uniref:hypothetical protein n=1 Tax=Hahella sp. KA22 TaxID=1628392 RepID=UPI000FDDA128|nr:hypothetical protein [Hahella sp. KA22]AZZ94876.1 hypothetical protein ENC22_28250 [Hahella sp. KA22]QAY58249.1 hypothetical protein EUZ85_30835 [Hahella sp. KA22]
MTTSAVVKYLLDNAETLSLATLKKSLTDIAQWHQRNGFADPTQASTVKKALEGIKKLHPHRNRQVSLIQIEQLSQLAQWLDRTAMEAKVHGDRRRMLRQTRDKALVLLSFWFGLQDEELSRLCVEDVNLNSKEHISVFISRYKGTGRKRLKYYKTIEPRHLCPIQAYKSWLDIAALSTGAVFRSVNRWGRIGESPLHAGSIRPIFRQLFQNVGLPRYGEIVVA